MGTNKKDVKFGILKGVLLLVLSCIFVVINPILLDRGESFVSAATTTDIETARKDALEELKNVYKTYNKKYYKAKAYKKLTKYYNKGVRNIKKTTSINKVEEYLEKYCDLMNGISPSILVKYQKKMEAKLLNSYKNLITKNTYSDNNLETIEDIKNEGINKIYETITKTQAKKIKNTYINNLKTVKNVLDETKEAAYNYINSIKNLSETEKNKLIDQVSKMTKENDVIVLMEENGYDQKGVIEDYVETNPNKMTKDILNDEDELIKYMEEWEKQYLDDSRNYDVRYYYDSSNKMKIFNETTHKCMIYLLNYKYIDSDISSKFYADYVNSKNYEFDYTLSTEEWWGAIATAFRGNLNIDYGCLIIEDNDTKGVGELINKMIKAVNESDGKELDKLLTQYFDKYFEKNVTLDMIVCKILVNKSSLIDIRKYPDTINSFAKFEKIKDEYLFSKIKSKEYTKTLSKE